MSKVATAAAASVVTQPVLTPARGASRPSRPLPAGACDCHAHVFGPLDRFPLSAERSYDPPLAPFEAWTAMLDAAGLARGVLVHPSAYGSDHRPMLDALARAPDRLRGVAVVTPEVTDRELDAMHAAGVRAARFTESGGTQFAGNVGVEAFPALAPRLKERGWHAQVWIPCAPLVAVLPSMLATGVPVVADHMGRFDVAQGVDAPAFRALLAMLADGGGEGRLWVKLSVCRSTPAFPDYPDARPFHDALVAANPHRVVWASDWPHIRMGERTPDVGHLLDLFMAWLGDDALAARILSANPAALYGFATPA